MRFKEGNVVEVFRSSDEDQYGGWFTATILFVNGHMCTVRYEFLLAPEGDLVVEVVNEGNVRPQPPQETKEIWIAGDIVEVFEQDSWRVGKIVKVLKNGCVVMRLFGSIQLKEFHSSSLRIQQTWRDNRWIVLDKVQGNHDVNRHVKSIGPFYNARDVAPGGEDRSVKRPKQDHGDSHMTTTRRKPSSCYGLGPDGIIEGTSKGKKGSSNGDGSHQMDKYALPKKVDAISVPKKSVAGNSLHESRKIPKPKNSCMRDNRCHISDRNIRDQVGYPYLKPLEVSEENIECSVASCSANQFHGYTNAKNKYRPRKTDLKLLDDAMSSCPSDNVNDNQSLSAVDLAASIHELELHAYRSTMQALHASGSLSWEQESLLTNLRLCLNISNEEHLLHLRNLLSV